jgi:hypothetical protein
MGARDLEGGRSIVEQAGVAMAGVTSSGRKMVFRQALKTTDSQTERYDALRARAHEKR